MKVGILTFHEVFNPGAFLQALASQRLVESLGHEANIIDYTPKNHSYSFLTDCRKLSWRLPLRFPRAMANWRKDIAFENARKRWMNLTQKFESSADVAKEKFDAVMIGADVVWNFVIEQYGRDPIYFGKGLNTKKRISFAPSFGPCSIEDDPPPYVTEGLKSFDHLSVRDINSQSIVKTLIGEEPPIICDPAFHLDQNQLPLENPERRPYLLVYMLAQYVPPETVVQIKEFAKKRGLKIVATLYHQKWADQNRTDEGPMDWLGLIHHADYVVTNTFHGLVFCSKMEKKFALQYTPSIRSKSLYTVEKLGIDPLLINDQRSVEEVLNSDFCFDGVRQQIDQLTAHGRQFLVNALDSE